MSSLLLQAGDEGTQLEVLPPVLFNTWKHHAGALRRRIAAVGRGGPAALAEAAAQTAVLGTGLMDLYTGSLLPRELSEQVREQLRAAGRLEREAYRAWLEGQGRYALLTLPGEETQWVLRLGEEDRYVHLHPGRWSASTLRVRANVLKTAVMVLAHVAVHGGEPLDRDVVNAVRAEHLGLSPVGRDLEGEQGLGAVVALLRG
jgi:hypothetical protein